MPEMLHRIYTGAGPTRVFDLLRSAEGLRQWWTIDASGGQNVGDVLELGFNGRSGVIHLRVDEILPGQRVAWTCAEHVGGMEEWPGTTLVWTLTPWKSTATEVRLTHARWKTGDGEFPTCNTTWGLLMHRLKQVAEGATLGPMFR
jgi:uncharacterized protein YndB with AHSA1/START domain